MASCFIFLFFFFQAEDGIRDHCVTGVQTCALPLVGLVAALGILLAGSVPMLPERVATHFGPDGLPNGWTARESFVATMALVVVLPVAFMQGIGLVVGRLPPSLINLPTRDYWLAG